MDIKDGFYTSVIRRGNYLLYRGYGDNGEKVFRRIKYRPKAYVPAKDESNATWRSLEGEGLIQRQFDSMSEYRAYTKQYEGVSGFKIYGNSKHNIAFIADNFPKDVPYMKGNIDVISFDIETEVTSGFPDPSLAENTITVITCKSSRSDTYISWGIKDWENTGDANHLQVEYRQFDDEFDMLEDFLTWWAHPDNIPDAITGWNINGFDIPYLVNRISRLFDPDTAKKLSPWDMIDSRTYTMFGREQIEYTIGGIACLDYLDLYKKFTFTPRESYKLDFIAEEELGRKKLEFDGSLQELYENDFQRYLDYNIVDVELIDALENKLGLLGLVFELAYLGGVNYTDTLGTVGIWDAIIFRDLALKKIAVPPNENHHKASFAGGYVKEVTPGMYENVVSFDLNSLYPNLIIQYNMSPEKLAPRARDLNASIETILSGDHVPSEENSLDYAYCANGVAFKRDTQGFLPAIVEKIYNDRRSAKDRMLELSKAKEAGDETISSSQINLLDVRQMALKILMNSLYGAMGNVYFRYFNISVAEAITHSGQLTIRWSDRAINEWLSKVLGSEKDRVIAADTDSVTGNTLINVNGKNITISDYFETCEGILSRNDVLNKDFVKRLSAKDLTPSVSSEGELQHKEIKYVMKHRVNKRFFKIKNSAGESVTVTEDHSVIVKDENGKIRSLKPGCLNPRKHKIINIVNASDTDSGDKASKK